jgi:predicted dehydrogenase
MRFAELVAVERAAQKSGLFATHVLASNPNTKSKLPIPRAVCARFAMKKLKWGILSTAKIGVTKVIPALQRSQFGTVVAIASRDPAKGAAVAGQLGIPKIHDSYEALLTDPEIDAVYNPLPNHLHVPLSLQALAAGKHVLCEKPLGLTSEDAQRLLDGALAHPQLKVMEAFMYRHHPQWQKAKQLVEDGRIGQLRTVQSFFSYWNVDPANIRNHAELGGGAIMDIGCYCVSFGRWLFAQEPRRVLGIADIDPAFGTDRLTSGVLDFGTGTSTFTCSTQLSPYQRINIFGTEGRIEIEIPVNAPPDKPCRLWHQAGQTIDEIIFEPCDQYSLQGDVFARAVFDETVVPTPLTDGVANMRAVEAILESAKRSAWVSL